MADLLELLELLRNPGEEGPPDTIYDDIAATYNERVAEFTAEGEGYSNKVQELEGEISRLKAMNYDLLISSRGSESEDESEDDDSANDSDDDKGIDSLFG